MTFNTDVNCGCTDVLAVNYEEDAMETTAAVSTVDALTPLPAILTLMRKLMEIVSRLTSWFLNVAARISLQETATATAINRRPGHLWRDV